MIFQLSDGRSFDTDRDLTAPERHVLQKLFLWETLASSMEQFREKKKEALLKGWNNSGPVKEGPSLRAIISELEKRLAKRLNS
ncbi:MAG: hypothetical protein JRH08_12525 [Deltaproteobacteria bacterium]|nr:hypothetical protein [Deltaproteobacteria bacterium]MBW1929641.1 hypothetical protein [Deltaproteobacteria bacterium]MBW2025171.1 hypothetical protein [Deltaproteobacteria bacterium]MBW2126493.1 hypothetical protein [Deltaproteobacteria bacterium]